MLYLAIDNYSPNTAPSNRVMAYVKALSEIGIVATIVFFFPNRNHNRVNGQYAGITFRYFWDRNYIDFPWLKKFSIRHYINRFVNSLNSGDKVYVYGFPDLVVALSHRSDIRVFAETTEHPEVSFVNFVNGSSLFQYISACRRIDGVIVISRGLREYFIANGCKEEKVHIINMIVDSSRFYGLTKQETLNPYIAYCGTATNSKDGVDQLIKAFAIFVKNNSNYKLYIIGNTPALKQKFNNFELVKELGIENNVVFTGVVPSGKIPQILKNAKILALARPDNKQAKYGFPTKLGEYLLTGNPVVVTKVGDIPLFLRDGDSALIAEPDDPKGFAAKLCWIIDHLDAALRIGETGKRLAEVSFNYLTETKKICSIIGE